MHINTKKRLWRLKSKETNAFIKHQKAQNVFNTSKCRVDGLSLVWDALIRLADAARGHLFLTTNLWQNKSNLMSGKVTFRVIYSISGCQDRIVFISA